MSDSPERRRLESWKAIAAHLSRTVRTVQRWEREEGLPVHRLEHHTLSSIYAYVDELDARWENDIITVVIPEFVVPGVFGKLLHNQSALLLKGRLLFRKGTVVISVPYHLDD